MDETVRQPVEIIFATQNQNKVREVQRVLPQWIKLVSLRDLGFNDELEENHDTLKANAVQKSQFVNQRFRKPCFSEDSGLEVDALDGAPGVKSARYAGNEKSNRDNINLLLENMRGIVNRKARFRAVVAFTDGNRLELFEGICNGRIALQPEGGHGFGYDPVFIPDGYDQTFGQLPDDVKHQISHRTQATRKFCNFVESNWMPSC